MILDLLVDFDEEGLRVVRICDGTNENCELVFFSLSQRLAGDKESVCRHVLTRSICGLLP